MDGLKLSRDGGSLRPEQHQLESAADTFEPAALGCGLSRPLQLGRIKKQRHYHIGLQVVLSSFL
jgi:hypothetical protein